MNFVGTSAKLSRRSAFLGLLLLTTLLTLLVGGQQANASEVVPRSEFSSEWTGPAANTRLGEGLSNVGDMNGDGIDDFLTSTKNVAAERGYWILFGPVSPSSPPDLGNLDPAYGYKITFSGAQGISFPVGDQNNDGLTDVIILVANVPIVIYGVDDPATDLVDCDAGGPDVTRCIDSTNPQDISGNRLGFALSFAEFPSVATPWTGADLDGDGTDELVVPTNAATGLIILKNNLGSGCDPAPGLCTIDTEALVAPDRIEVEAPGATIPFGQFVASPGDFNGDGRDDLVVASGSDGAAQPGIWVIYGQDWTASPVTTSDLPSSEGYKMDAPFSSVGLTPFTVGDVNGDGLADVGILSVTAVPTPSVFFSFIYGEAGTPDRAVDIDAPGPGVGVRYDWDMALGFPNNVFAALGDLNGDGADEVGIGQPTAAAPGANTGVVAVVLGGDKGNDNVLPLGLSSPPSTALMLTGATSGAQFGSGLASAGDFNDDGIPDLAIAAGRATVTLPGPTNATNAGVIGRLSSARYFGQATTGLAGSIGQTTATVGGTATANGRESVAYFEYGTTDAYGQATDEQAIGRMNAGQFVEATLTGLTADTEYHYRTVVENDIGIKSYGPDRSFKTDAVDPGPPDPPGPCEINPTAPGCSGYCPANPNAAACAASKPGLGQLIASSNASKVKRGKSATVSTWITSTGTADASSVKVCLKAPKKLVKGAKCQTVGNLAPGQTAAKKFKVTVKKKAKKGKKVTLSFTASSTGLDDRNAKVKIAVK